MNPLCAIVGRPNVGKSTLFNRLIRARRAIVQDDPGVTRDRHYGVTRIDEREIELVDTGGFIPDAGHERIEALIREQARIAIDEADVILMVMDARQGPMPADRELVDLLRRTGKPVIHAANKVDGPKQDALTAEFFELGVERVIGVSAEHARGMEDLLDALIEALPPDAAHPAASADGEAIAVALVGRPNAGKSSLFNALCGQDRVIVSDEPGTTRDPVDVRLGTEADGEFVLVDTAGIRRKRAKSTTMERFAIVRALRSISSARVVCLVIDAEVGPTDQDAKLANMAEEAGRGLVVVPTKCDLLKRRVDRDRLEQQLTDRLGFAEYAPVVRVSSITRQGLKRILPTVRRVHDSCGERVPTAELNRFLEEAVAAHAPPSHHGRQVRLYYITQPKVHPPTFIVSTNAPQGIRASYRRFLANRLRERYRFEGAPLRLFFRGKGREKRDPRNK
jgi:GTP-binding protein